MKATIKDRIVAHRSAPDVYDPPTFEQMADRIEQLEAKLEYAVGELQTMLTIPNSQAAQGILKTFAGALIAELTGGKDE